MSSDRPSVLVGIVEGDADPRRRLFAYHEQPSMPPNSTMMIREDDSLAASPFRRLDGVRGGDYSDHPADQLPETFGEE